MDIFEDEPATSTEVAAQEAGGLPAKRTRFSKRRLAKEIQQTTAEHLPKALTAALKKALEMIESGNEKTAPKAIALVLEAAGLRRGAAGTVINVNQQNVNNGGGQALKSFDAIVRRRALLAQNGGPVIDVTPERE
jgi:hypothetical protein